MHQLASPQTPSHACTCKRPKAPFQDKDNFALSSCLIAVNAHAPIIECTSGGSSLANRPTASPHSLGSSPANGTLAHRLPCKESGTWGGTANPFANPWSPQLHKATFAASRHESIISPQAKCSCRLGCIGRVLNSQRRSCILRDAQGPMRQKPKGQHKAKANRLRPQIKAEAY